MLPRFATVAAIQLLAVAAAFADPGQRDPFFTQVPFEEWRSGGKQSLGHWSVEIVPAELSGFQRIAAGVKVYVDGPELPSHRALLLLEFSDPNGGVWQTHGSLDHRPEYVQNAFVLPGDYTISIALYDPVSGRHGFTQRKLHVPTLKPDPLPGSWEGLPPVEFIPANVDIPDAWFLPSITNRLRISVPTERPVHVEVLVNVTPSERATDTLGEFRRNMSAVIPALKVVSQLDLPNGSIDVSFLDLTRRKVQGPGSLEWETLKGVMAQANTGTVDVRALDGRWKMRTFLLDQVAEKISGRGEEPARAVIVLSGPAFLEDQEALPKLELPSDPLRRVFYIRCRLIPRSVLAPRPQPRPGVRPSIPRPPNFRLPLDELEQPFDGSGARIFDVITPEQFRRVLAAVIRQISML